MSLLLKNRRFIYFVYFIYLELDCFNAYAQCQNQQAVWNSLNEIESNSDLKPKEKLEKLYVLKNTADKCNQHNDSVYARILLRIGFYEFLSNNNYSAAIKNTDASIRINTSSGKNGSKFFTMRGYFSLAKYYDMLGIFSKALTYYDSTIAIINSFPDTTEFLFYAKYNKVCIHFLNGDYQKAIDESINGMQYSLQKKDTSAFIAFLNQKAQSLCFENKVSNALFDLETVIPLAKNQKEFFELATALITKAMVLKKTQSFSQANALFDEAIKIRTQTKDYRQISLDYIDYGNFLLDSLRNYKDAKNKYFNAIEYAKKANDSTTIALANINIGEIYLDQKQYTEANNYCVNALSYLNMPVRDIISQNPSSDKLNAISSKQLPVVIINNKIETLLGIFHSNKSRNALSGCLKTCLVMDTLITKMRHMQVGNESKLYWRNYTREFYTNAIEASYLADKPALAFYFMEKSRAVLLNDKLNELNASSYLSKEDAAKQEDYEIKIISLEQKLAAFADTTNQYSDIQLQLINTRNDYEQFIKSLEKKYPAYYQYKYADSVSDLKDLQQFLSKNNQSFVHYFFGDTVTYILSITSNGTKLIRLSQKQFNKEKLAEFLQMCTNKEAINNHYDSFAALSNSIYNAIFRPLQIPTGRVIICTDNSVIPFDALCTDLSGKQFLLNDYSFDYVYSARLLMKQFHNPVAKGNFLGFAPVSFSSHLNVIELSNSANALQASASYYSNDKLFTHTNASRNNFFYYTPQYSIVSIFSHARADTTDNEPVLYMQDTLIHLSELQMLDNPATKLVLLSACQTNVGKAATGEGIYSLARGFATAGIPSVAATLWKADEQTIYAISEKFNQYLSEGMTKDEALQKAKLYFIQNNSSNEKSLPYYWANMILIGNTDAIHFSTPANNYWWTIIASIILIAAAATIILWNRNFKRKNRFQSFKR